MKALRILWMRQDAVNRIILVSGISLAVVCLIMGEGMYGVVVMAMMGAFCITHYNGRVKRLSRLYGSLFYHAPDGEIVPMTFEQVREEYVHGKGMRYMDRRVTVRFPYWRTNMDGELETGYGLNISLEDFTDTEGLLPTLKTGQYISVTGRLIPEGRQYFYLGGVEEIRRISAKELKMV